MPLEIASALLSVLNCRILSWVKLRFHRVVVCAFNGIATLSACRLSIVAACLMLIFRMVRFNL